MPLEKKIIEELIKSSIPDAKVIIEDLRGDGEQTRAFSDIKYYMEPFDLLLDALCRGYI